MQCRAKLLCHFKCHWSFQVHRLTEELAASRQTMAAEAHAEELQAAVAATCAAELQGAAAAEVAARRLAEVERQLADSQRVAAAAEQQAAELQADMQEAEERIQAAEAACHAARQQAADAERDAGPLRQQLSDGQLGAAALQRHLAEAVHERDAVCAELDAVRTAAALTGGTLTTSAVAAHGAAGAAPAEQQARWHHSSADGVQPGPAQGLGSGGCTSAWWMDPATGIQRQRDSCRLARCAY